MTNELKKLLTYINNDLAEEYPTNRITADYYVFGLLMSKDTLGNEALSNILLESSMNELKMHFHNSIQGNVQITPKEPSYDKNLKMCLENTKKILCDNNIIPYSDEELSVNTIHVLAAVLLTNENIKFAFRRAGVTIEQLAWKTSTAEEEEVPLEEAPKEEEVAEKPQKHVRNKPKKTSSQQKKEKKKEDDDDGSFYHIPLQSPLSDDSSNRMLTFLTQPATRGSIQTVLFRDEIYKEIFTTLSKREKNNVVIVGESGVGKTALIKHLANLITQGKVPSTFENAEIIIFNVAKGFVGTLKAPLEVRLRTNVDYLKKKSNCIFVIDDIDTTLFGNHKIMEPDAWNILSNFLDEEDAHFICTTTNKGYSNIFGTNTSMAAKTQKILLPELTEEQCEEIIMKGKEAIENYHDVKFNKETITNAIRFAKRYETNVSLPESAFDILDLTGAMLSLEVKPNKEVLDLKERIKGLNAEKEKVKTSSDSKEYDTIDQITQDIIALETEIKLIEKCEAIDKKPHKVSVADLKRAVSKKVGITVNELSTDDRKRLKGMSDDLKKIVIGQDEAVDEVCKVVKRQRVGLSDPDKPAVLFFGGPTGTGKTYLAKKLAEKVFGSEDDMVRLDMSEYNDRISINKLYGTSAGYIGYEQGGILSESIKKKKHCVLLLDEMEKADPAVHDVFLQIFDEGHLTDNKGTLVDFRNVIIIMTSNVGAVEVSERGGGVGFVRGDSSYNKSIIEKALRKKFKPEFINRIDRVIYFNNLNDDNLRNIISLEIDKVAKKIGRVGYSLDETLTNEEMVGYIFSKAVEQRSYGARPILKIIQSEIDDKIVDEIIEGNVKKGHKFTKSELFIGT